MLRNPRQIRPRKRSNMWIIRHRLLSKWTTRGWTTRKWIIRRWATPKRVLATRVTRTTAL